MSKIELACFDFDGVFSDGKISFDQEGFIIKYYNVKDGMGINLLREKNIKICVISGYKKNLAVKNICKHLKIDYLYEEIKDKKEVIYRLIKELNITKENVSYMGDDLNDKEILQSINLKGCPINSVEEIKEICNFISEYKGGEGCVRDFCEYILKYNSKPTISGLICVKYTSTRLPMKNFRKFGNTTLLDIKINRLLELDYLDEVIINSESDYILEYINENYKNNKIKLIKRDNKYSEDNVENSDFVVNVVKNIHSEYVLYSPVTMPFIEKNTYFSMFDKIKNKNYDSIVLIADGKQGNGHNNEKHKFCFGASLMKKDIILNFKDFIGEKPYFEKCNVKERIDIDYPEEFSLALYHYFNYDSIYGNELSLENNHIYKLKEEIKNIKINYEKKIEIIDVTVRDGGFTNNWGFSKEYVKKIMKTSSEIGIQYFEIGYITNEEFLKKEDKVFRNIPNSLIKELCEEVKPESKISVLFDSYRFDVKKLLQKEETYIDLIRVVTYFGQEEIKKALEQCRVIKEKGYSVSLNIMCISYFTEEIMDMICSLIIKHIEYLDFVYLADTFGNMTPSKTVSVFSKFKEIKKVKSSLKIGFHIHNNGQMAMANMISSYDFIDIMDVSWSGMGRGAGNLRLEDAILYLIIVKKYNLDIKRLLDYIEESKDQNKIEDIKNTILGFNNIHPNRIKYSKDKTIYEFYNYIINLNLKEKMTY